LALPPPYSSIVAFRNSKQGGTLSKISFIALLVNLKIAD